MNPLTLRRCADADLTPILAIVNDGAGAYRGAVPEDRLADPYMSLPQLQHEIAEGVQFWGCVAGEQLVGVMGLQSVADVVLIRHAYVRTGFQKQGVGTALLLHLQAMAGPPVLIGTWAAASWAIRFYQRHGFRLVAQEAKEQLLRRYWKIPTRQIDTSVVLADAQWFERSTGKREQT